MLHKYFVTYFLLLDFIFYFKFKLTSYFFLLNLEFSVVHC